MGLLIVPPVGSVSVGVTNLSGGIVLRISGNTSGTTALVSSGTLSLAGGNNITLSQAGNAITISGPSGGGIGVSSGGNTLGTTGTVGQQYVLVGGNNVTLSQSVTSGSATVTISAGGANPLFIEVNGPITGTPAGVADLTAASFSHRPILQPFYQPGNALQAKTVRLYLSRTAGATLNATMGIGFYTQGNSTSLALVSSATQAYSLSTSAEWSGVRAVEFTNLSGMTLSQGAWFMGFHLSASNTSTAVGQVQLVGPGLVASAFTAGTIGTGADVSSAPVASNLLSPFMGVYSNTANLLPAAIGASEMLGSASNQAAAWYALIKEI